MDETDRITSTVSQLQTLADPRGTQDMKRIAVLLALLAAVMVEVAQGDIYRRSLLQSREISASVDHLGRSLIACPQTCLYQDVEWIDPADVSGLETFCEEGRQYVWVRPTADEAQKPVLSYRVKRYRVEVDFSQITQIYPYDTSSELYRHYTRQPSPDACGYLAIDTTDSWIVQTANVLQNTAVDALGYARAAHALIANEFTYDMRPNSIAEVVNAKRGKCFWLSAVYVSLLRRGGIPARVIMAEKGPGFVEIGHAWAEFYLEGYGWIPSEITADVCLKTGLGHFGMNDDTRIVTATDVHMRTTLSTGKRIYSYSPPHIWPCLDDTIDPINYIDPFVEMEANWNETGGVLWQRVCDLVRSHPYVSGGVIVLLLFLLWNRRSPYC